MKRIAYSVLLCLLAGFPAFAAEITPSDTTITYKGKLVNLEDSVGQIKVKVFDASIPNDTVPFKQVFEGIYSDTKSYEKWTVMEELGFQIPLFGKKRHHHDYRMDSHWSGIGFGLANVTNDFLKFESMNGFMLNASRSHEFFFNFSDKIIPLYRNNLGISTGIGLDWRNYHFDDNTHLVEVNGITSAYPAPDGIKYKFSRLRTVYLTIPLLLEWQPTFGNNHESYLAAGVVGGIKTLSSYKVKYNDSEGNTIKKVEDRGLNVAPLCLDYMAMAGINNFGVYAKYSPFGLFQKGKGPNVKAISIGLVASF